MKQTRMLTLLALLVAVVAIRWLDPLSKRQAQSEPEIAAAVVKPAQPSVASASTVPAPTSVATWPVRAPADTRLAGNAFMSRGEVAQQDARRQQEKMAKMPVYTPPPPPPPPPPPEPPPPLQVIGTWGSNPDLAVFLATPNGTLLAHQGDMLMATYRVQTINTQRITLVQTGNQKIWTLDIPSAPTNLQTWPAS